MPTETSPSDAPDARVGACLAAFLHDHSELLADLHSLANAAHWRISPDDFGAVLYHSAACRFGGLIPAKDVLEAYLRTLRLEDLALACALRLGSAQAWEEFMARYRPLLYAAARAIAGNRGEAYTRELADSLYGELYGIDRKGLGARRSLLEYFHGRSKLATWLHTVLAQKHVDFIRASRHNEPLPGSGTDSPSQAGTCAVADSLEESSRTGGNGVHLQAASWDGNSVRDPGDPDRARLLPRLRAALLTAFAALPAAERMLLAQYYGDDLTLAQIARMRGVHEATVSRHLDRIRRELREKVTSTLAARSTDNGREVSRGMTAAEIELCFTYAVEDWCFDLNDALRGNDGEKRW